MGTADGGLAGDLPGKRDTDGVLARALAVNPKTEIERGGPVDVW